MYIRVNVFTSGLLLILKCADKRRMRKQRKEAVQKDVSQGDLVMTQKWSGLVEGRVDDMFGEICQDCMRE